jgi:hypothetical protein
MLLKEALFRGSCYKNGFFRGGRGANGGGISVTQSSGSPYIHGRPRFPVQQPQQTTQPSQSLQLQYPQYTFSTGSAPTGATNQQLELQQLQLQQQQLMNGQGGYLQQGLGTNGFTPVSLSVPVSGGMAGQQTLQSLPVQAIRPIQPVQVSSKEHF